MGRGRRVAHHAPMPTTDQSRTITPATGVALGVVLVVLSSALTGGVLAGHYGSRMQTVEAQLSEARNDLKEWTKEVRAAREDIREIRVLIIQNRDLEKR